PAHEFPQFTAKTLRGLFHKYAHVRGNGFWAEARRERRAYPAVDLRSKQQRLRPKDMPPCGLRPIWPVASLLGRSSIAADTLPPSRLATGQIGRNERMRIYEIDHLGF